MSRKSYKDYDESFFAIVKKFEQGDEAITISGTFGSLVSIRLQFHRFRIAMMQAASTDTYAREKSNLIRGLSLSIIPAKSSDTQTPATLTIAYSDLHNQLKELVNELGPGDLPEPDAPSIVKDPVVVEKPKRALGFEKEKEVEMPKVVKVYDVGKLEELIRNKEK